MGIFVFTEGFANLKGLTGALRPFACTLACNTTLRVVLLFYHSESGVTVVKQNHTNGYCLFLTAGSAGVAEVFKKLLYFMLVCFSLLNFAYALSGLINYYAIT